MLSRLAALVSGRLGSRKQRWWMLAMLTIAVLGLVHRYHDIAYQIPLGGSDTRHVEIFGSIDNIFDRKPPISPGGGGGGGSNYPTNPVYFDTFGSKWRAGLRFRY